MSNRFCLAETQTACLRPYFRKNMAVPRVADRRGLSGAIFEIRDGLRWCDASREDGRRRRSAIDAETLYPTPKPLDAFGIPMRHHVAGGGLY